MIPSGNLNRTILSLFPCATTYICSPWNSAREALYWFMAKSNFFVLSEFFGDQMYVVAQGNNESIVLFKFPDGIIAFNWASAEYKGARKNVGSMANGLSDCIGFVNELVEREMIGGEKF